MGTNMSAMAGSTSLTPGSYLLHQADCSPDKVFLVDMGSDERLTYRDTAAAAAVVSQRLAASGVQPGDRVVLLAENGWRWVAAFFGIQMLGAICVPVNTRLGRQDLDRAVVDARPARFLGDGRYLTNLAGVHKHQADALGDLLPSIRTEAKATPEDHGDPDAVGVITYTSGTTGTPKGVMLPQRAVTGSGEIMATAFNSNPASRVAVMVPLFHNTGFVDAVMHMAVVGGAVELHPRFRPAQLRAAFLERHHTFFMGVPTMYVRLLETVGSAVVPGVSPWLGYGGAGMVKSTIDRLQRFLPDARLVNCYGLSEATSLTHYLPWLVAAGRTDFVGIPVPGTLDRLADPAGSEIEIRSPNVMLGYWDNPQATAEKLCLGWLKTGDLGARDDAGMLRIVGRTDDIINRGGEKVAPFEVESALTAHPKVAEACVVGVPDHDLGEVVAAAYVCSPGAALDPSDLRAHLLGLIADFKIPTQLVEVAELPRNSHGKIVRRVVRRQLTNDT